MLDLEQKNFNGMSKTIEILQEVMKQIEPKFSKGEDFNEYLLKAIILLNYYE